MKRVGSLLVSMIVLTSCSRGSHEKERLDTLDQFCLATRNAVQTDRLAFESGDEVRREEAFGRFYEGQIMYHNASSILMCLDTIPKLAIGCRLYKNWQCLAQIAQEIETALPQR